MWEFGVRRLRFVAITMFWPFLCFSFDDGDFDDAEEDEGLDDLENVEDVRRLRIIYFSFFFFFSTQPVTFFPLR